MILILEICFDDEEEKKEGEEDYDELVFYVPFNIIYVIMRRWKLKGPVQWEKPFYDNSKTAEAIWLK